MGWAMAGRPGRAANARRLGVALVALLGVVVLATTIQGITSFSLTQLISRAGQRVIAEMRVKVQAHVGRLSVSYYDANKSGALVSRIMNDVEGVRNLVGTGLIELSGGLLTAVDPAQFWEVIHSQGDFRCGDCGHTLDNPKLLQAAIHCEKCGKPALSLDEG